MKPRFVVAALSCSLLACGSNANEGSEGEVVEALGPVRGELEITRIEVSQSLFQALYADEEVVSPVDYNVPLVPERVMWVRAWWDPPLEWDPRPLIGQLHLEGEDGEEIVLEDELSAQGTPPLVQGKTKLSELESSFYWRVPPELVQPGMRYSVTVIEPEARPDIPATEGKTRWPRDTNTALPVSDAPSRLDLFLVGVRYDIPGCTTDTTQLTPAEYEAIRAGFEVWTGVASDAVHIDTSLSVDLDSPHTPMQLLGVVEPLRAAYPSPDAFFYIMLDDCNAIVDGVLGMAPVLMHPPLIDQGGARYGAGLWHSNDVRESVNTAVHEIGHAQGAQHAPCGDVGGPDPEYPHANAQLGLLGFDPLEAVFYDPTLYADFMSYCRPYWVSDYRFFRSYVVQSQLTAWGSADLDDSLPLLPAGYTGEALSGVVEASGASSWWLSRNVRPPTTHARVDGPVQVSLRTAAGTRAMPSQVLDLPDAPGGAWLVTVPLVDGIGLEDIEGITVSGATQLQVNAPAIRDARPLQGQVRAARAPR